MKKMSAPAKPASARADEIMTVRTVALYLHCHPSYIHRMLKERQIPASKLASEWRFFRSAIDEWIARQYDTNPPVTNARKSKLS